MSRRSCCWKGWGWWPAGARPGRRTGPAARGDDRGPQAAGGCPWWPPAAGARPAGPLDERDVASFAALLGQFNRQMDAAVAAATTRTSRSPARSGRDRVRSVATKDDHHSQAVRRRAAIRARAGPARGDAVHLAGRARQHDHRHGGARRSSRDLGGFSQFPWLFSIYLLTQAVTVPLYGKLADVVGPQAGDVLRHRGVPARLGPVRRRVEHAGADRLPRGAGHRRRRRAADER